jgi:hypothetical protein
MNADLLAKLVPVRDLSYFRLFSVDMLASCEYLPQELFECYSQTCEIYPVDDELVCIHVSIISVQKDAFSLLAVCLQVPGPIKAVDHAEHEFELDGWARWDMPSEDYYDTDEFPESYVSN